jgi:hypothetical protein
MFGHQPIRQVLDAVDILFFYESSAHGGFRKGSTPGNIFHIFHRVDRSSQIVRLGFFTRRVVAPVLPTDLLGARFVARLLLSPLVAHDALILASSRTRLRLRRALLAAVLAALILYTFQIVFCGHRDQILLFALV